MPSYAQDIQFDLILPRSKITSHSQALLTLAKDAADYLNVSEKIINQRIHEKEELSSSAIGGGVAIPHIKMRRVRAPFTLLMSVDKDINHETPDNTPINLYCLLISPMSDGPIHLRRLSRLSRLLQNQTLRNRIRETQDRDVIQSLLMDPEGWLMAA